MVTNYFKLLSQGGDEFESAYMLHRYMQGTVNEFKKHLHVNYLFYPLL